jgi:predicted transcriptional regulator
MDTGELEELVNTLTRRRDVLAVLDDRSVRKPALATELDVARSTVDRAIRELQAQGLVVRGEDGFELTTCGGVAVDLYGRFASRLGAMCDAQDVVAQLPSREFAHPDVLSGADVVRATTSAPDRPVRAFLDLVDESTHVRGCSPTAYGAYVDVFERRVVNAGMTAELVFSDEALAELTTTYRDPIQRAVDTGRVDVSRVDRLPMAGVSVLTRDDGTRVVAMGVYDGTGLVALVVNETPDALAWADALLDEHFERADEMPV